MAKLNYSEIQPNDLLVEFPKYVVKEVLPDAVIVSMIKKDGDVLSLNPRTIRIEKDYVVEEMFTDSQYEKVVEVTKEDKLDGTPGIRTIFQGLPAGTPFTVTFKKVDKKLSDKAYKKALADQRDAAVKKILDTQKSKKGVADIAVEVLKEIQENPVLDFIPGEIRTLRGYKLSNEIPIDGRYDTIEVSTEKGQVDIQIRPVTITAISSLCVYNTMYIVK